MHIQTKLNKQRNQQKRQREAQAILARAVERVAQPILASYHKRMDKLVATLQLK